MKVAVFSTKNYDRMFLEAANRTHGHELIFLEPRLTPETVSLASGYPAVCLFVNDQPNAGVLTELARGGTRLIALRSAGFNHVDLEAAWKLGLTVVRVPAYSPHAVAEHTAGLILSLNRRIHRAYARVREGNFALDGLLGFDLYGRTVGIVGTGQIGLCVAQIMNGFGCRLVGFDPYPSSACKELGLKYLPLHEVFAVSDIVTLHCPLTAETHHVIDAAAIGRMKSGVMLINSGRGALIHTQSVIEALKTGKIGYLGLDVYEEEANLFFEDLSEQVLQDDVFARLLTFPNVIITGHQGFFTEEALTNISETTLANITAFERGSVLANAVSTEQL
jgi:D-lactate dehydrogenase